MPLRRSSRTDCHIGFGSRSLSLGYASLFGMTVSRSSFGKVPCPVGDAVNVLAERSFRFQPLRAAQGNVSEILLFNFQRAWL